MIVRYANIAADEGLTYTISSLEAQGENEYTAKKILLHYASSATGRPTVARKCGTGHTHGAGRNTGMPWTSY